MVCAAVATATAALGRSSNVRLLRTADAAQLRSCQCCAEARAHSTNTNTHRSRDAGSKSQLLARSHPVGAWRMGMRSVRGAGTRGASARSYFAERERRRRRRSSKIGDRHVPVWRTVCVYRAGHARLPERPPACGAAAIEAVCRRGVAAVRAKIDQRQRQRRRRQRMFLKFKRRLCRAEGHRAARAITRSKWNLHLRAYGDGDGDGDTAIGVQNNLHLSRSSPQPLPPPSER